MANGVLVSNRSRHGKTTWVWNAKEPMASYLTTATIGEFDVTAYRQGRIRYWDAIDPDLFTQVSPRTGTQYLLSQEANFSYKRFTRTISVPAGGATALVLGRPRHRARLGLHVRRGAPPPAPTTGPRCPTSTATRATAPATPARSAGRHPPVPRALPDRQRRRHLHRVGHAPACGGPRAGPAAATSSGRSTSPPTPERQCRGLDQLRQRRHRAAPGCLRRRRRGLERPGRDLVRERR